MKIEFYGSSIIGSNTFQLEKPKSFYDLILDHFNASSLNYMIAQCSEERILYNLKKTSEIDVAIIFHSTPQFIYFPNFTRDFMVMQDHEIDDWMDDTGALPDSPDGLGPFPRLHACAPQRPAGRREDPAHDRGRAIAAKAPGGCGE